MIRHILPKISPNPSFPKRGIAPFRKGREEGFSLQRPYNYGLISNINPRDKNVKVKNNIIFSNFQYNLSIQGFGNPYTPSGLEIDYNLYYNAGSANIRFSDSSGKEYNYNLLKFRANTPYGVHDIEADPNCVDTASGNFRLNGNSPALNAGFDLSEIFYRDRDGNSLPKGSAWDMGAYKYIDVKPPSTLSAPSGLKNFHLKGTRLWNTKKMEIFDLVY